MKTKLSLTFLVSCFFCLVSLQAQIPQGFNYQAVARDGSGNVLQNTPLQVMFYIQSLQTGGTLYWKELHSGVTTSSFGLFSLTLGNGVRQTESTAATFDLVDWRVTPKFLKTEIFYSGDWHDLGTSQLLSVPYAMVAEDLAGSVKKLAVAGETSGLEEALFEVKNKDGQTVFAVYNEGVRVYVSNGAKALKGGFAVGGFGTDKAESTKYLFVGKDSVRIYLDTNPLTKGVKTGFAVGGYDLTKGTVQNYLDVSSDSVRIYIDSNPDTKALKGGFAVGGYDMTKGIIGDYFNVSGKSDAEAINGESRVLWYPAKEAFRSGNVLIESKDSVGLNSWASGYRSKAIGNYSQALGYQAIARKDYSTAIGYQAVANKINSFAFGQWATAKNEESYAFGRGAIAEGKRSYAFGSAGVDSSGAVTGVAYAKGDYSFAIGQGSQSLGKGSFTFGLADTAKGNYSIAIGHNSVSEGDRAITLGHEAVAKFPYSMALGSFSKAMYYGATAIGQVARADGYYSTAIGWGAEASGYVATAIGGAAEASGYVATAIGFALASGDYTLAMGNLTQAQSAYETVMGRYNTKYTPVSTSGWNDNDRLFVIGKGTSDGARSNAMTVLKNGCVGIGTSTPLSTLHVKGNAGIFRLEGTDHCYMEWFPDGPTTRKGFIGYPGATINDLTLSNEISTGDIILLPGSGKVGIGTSAPTYPLEVRGYTTWSGTAGFLNYSGTTGQYTGPVNYSIYSEYSILASEFHAFSDARIKRDINYSNGEEDLFTLNNLSVRDFRYIDFNINGDNLKKGFVAQEVEEVFPEAVNYATRFIPDIYARAEKVYFDQKNKTLSVILNKPHNLKMGDMVEIYTEEAKFQKSVIQVVTDLEFIVSGWDKYVDQVFVYGKNVDDFMTVDYDKIFTLGISAIQELSRQNKEQQQQIESQNQKIEQLSKKISDMEGKIASSSR